MVVAVVIIFFIALLAAFARPGWQASCPTQSESESSTPSPTPPVATNGKPFPWTNVRLPTNVRPIRYDLYMHPDLVRFRFNGSVDITLQCKDSGDTIVFHSKNLTLSSRALFKVTGTGERGQQIQVTDLLENIGHEQVWIKLGESLEAGRQYVLRLEFSGFLTDSLAGFYRSSYTTSSGEKRWDNRCWSSAKYLI